MEIYLKDRALSFCLTGVEGLAFKCIEQKPRSQLRWGSGRSFNDTHYQTRTLGLIRNLFFADRTLFSQGSISSFHSVGIHRIWPLLLERNNFGIIVGSHKSRIIFIGIVVFVYLFYICDDNDWKGTEKRGSNPLWLGTFVLWVYFSSINAQCYAKSSY